MLKKAVKKKLPPKKTDIPEVIALTAPSINAASYLLAICMGNAIACGLKKAAFSWSGEVISPVATRSMIILSVP